MAPIPGLFARPHFLDASLLDELRAHVESAEGDPAAVQPSPGAPLAVAHEVRRAWEVELPDALHDRLLDGIEGVRDELAAFFGVPLEPCEAVAALRYPPGALYRSHRDASATPDAHGLHRRVVSLVVFLNSAEPAPGAAFAGGRLRFHDVEGPTGGPLDVAPVAGTMVAFSSSWLHEVTPVESGTRATIAAWLLRPDGPGRKRR